MKTVLFFCLLIPLALSLYAQKPKVAVTAIVEERGVIDEYPSQILRIETSLRDTFLYYLNTTFPYLEFTSDTADCQITISLSNPESDSANYSPRDAKLLRSSVTGSLVSPGVKNVEFKVSPRRILYEFPPEAESFVGEVAAIFHTELVTNKHFFVDCILSHIQVSSDAIYLNQAGTWVIPLTYRDSKLAKTESKVKIVLYPQLSFQQVRTIDCQVQSALCEQEVEHPSIDLPNHYKVGSLVLLPVQSMQLSLDSYDRKKVYITKFHSLSTSGLSFENFKCNDYNNQ